VRIFGNGRANAEEIAQEVWLEAWQRNELSPGEGGYDSQWSFYTYLIKCIAQYRIMEWNKKHNKDEKNLLWVNWKDERETDNTNVIDTDDPQAMLLRIEDLREELITRYKTYGVLFYLLFLCGGYPHQQLSFAYSKLLYGRKTPRGFDGDADKTARIHGKSTLYALYKRFLSEYHSQGNFPRETRKQHEEYIKPLEERLNYVIERLTERDKNSYRLFRYLHGEEAGSIALEQYYVQNKKGYAAIHDWSNKVKDRIKNIVICNAELFIDEEGKNSNYLNLESYLTQLTLKCNRCLLSVVSQCPEVKGTYHGYSKGGSNL